jgi:hypothetical protein
MKTILIDSPAAAQVNDPLLKNMIGKNTAIKQNIPQTDRLFVLYS